MWKLLQYNPTDDSWFLKVVGMVILQTVAIVGSATVSGNCLEWSTKLSATPADWWWSLLELLELSASSEVPWARAEVASVWLNGWLVSWLFLNGWLWGRLSYSNGGSKGLLFIIGVSWGSRSGVQTPPCYDILSLLLRLGESETNIKVKICKY